MFFVSFPKNLSTFISEHRTEIATQATEMKIQRGKNKKQKAKSIVD